MQITINTTITPGGQFPDTITVVYDEIPAGKIEASDFVMTGKATNWRDKSLHDFTAEFSNAKLDGNTLKLTFAGFDDKFFYVQSFEVINKNEPALGFTSEQPYKVIAPVADEFKHYSWHDGDGFEYNLYTPEDAKGALPLVVVFHGFSDTHNTLIYRTSVAWAESEAQKKRPCYVLSPIACDYQYYFAPGRTILFRSVYKKIQKMIKAGQVDPSRIYVMGNSFGGMSTVEFTKKYPNVAAAAMPLCPALNYSKNSMKHLEKIVHIPMWIAQAENDHTIPSENGKNLYKNLTELGAKEVKLRIYTDEEMNAAGGSPEPNSKFSYHHVEMAVMEDEAYAEWLFSHSKQ